MVIKKEKRKFVLRSKSTGKVIGRFDTREEAKKREKQIRFFKNKGNKSNA